MFFTLLLFTLSPALSIFIFFILVASMRWVRLRRQSVEIVGLDPALAGLKILHLTDLHNRSKSRKTINIWPKIFRQDFDIAVITGDLITGDFKNILPHAEDLKTLAASVPTYFVEGNHDVLYRDRIGVFLEGLGIRYLHNEKVLCSHNDAPFYVIGTREFTDLRHHHFKQIRPLMTSAYDFPSAFKLVLTHQPQTFTHLKTYAPSLVLSGHTHGGQIRLPFVPTLFAPNQGLFPRYGSGFYHEGAATLYVSRGIGATTFPFRFWNRPEINIFELHRKG